MKAIAFLFFAIFSLPSYAQFFEGKIVYQNTYRSKIANVNDEQLSSMMGTTQEYFIKEGNYKSIFNGSLVQWQLYVNRENKVYSKMSNSETVFWNDAASSDDEVLGMDVYKNKVEILGYKCDEILLSYKSGKYHYFFNENISVNSTLFINHKLSNWYDYLSA